MTQADLGLFPGSTSGTAGAALLRNWRDAVHSRNKGPAAPSYAQTGMVWIDDANDPIWIVKSYDGADWIVEGVVNKTTNQAYPLNVGERQNYPLAGGTANALTLTPAVAMTAYTDRDVVTFEAASNNPGAATLNVSGVGAKAIRKIVGGAAVALAANDILGGVRYTANFSAVADAWLLTGQVIGAGSQGKVLTSDGVSPGWEEPDIKVLANGAFSGAQNDIVLTSYIAAGYSRFRLHWREWQPVTSGSQLLLLVSTNGGSSFVASGYAGQALFAQGSAPTVASAGSGSNSAFNVVMGTANTGGFATGHVDVDILANYVSVRSYTHTVTTTPAHAVYLLTGHVAATGANAIRLAPSAGNHSAGQYTLYGLRNS